MSFRNAVVSGLTLVREAIQSLGYVAGSVGWAVNRDGSAEFSDATIRGTVDAATINGADINGGTIDAATITGGRVFIPSADGTQWVNIEAGIFSLVRDLIAGGLRDGEIKLTASSNGANIFLYPPELSTSTVVRGALYATSAAVGLGEARLIIEGASINTNPYPSIELFGDDAATSRMRLRADRIELYANDNGVGGSAAGAGNSSVDLSANNRNSTAASVTRNGGKSFIINDDYFTNSNPSATTASATYSTIPSSALSNFAKEYSDTALVAELDVSCWLNGAAPSEVEFVLNVDGVDYSVTNMVFNVAGQHLCVVRGKRKITGLSNGSYTVTPKWRRANGTGTFTMDGADRITVSVREIRT